MKISSFLLEATKWNEFKLNFSVPVQVVISCASSQWMERCRCTSKKRSLSVAFYQELCCLDQFATYQKRTASSPFPPVAKWRATSNETFEGIDRSCDSCSVDEMLSCTLFRIIWFFCVADFLLPLLRLCLGCLQIPSPCCCNRRQKQRRVTKHQIGQKSGCEYK